MNNSSKLIDDHEHLLLMLAEAAHERHHRIFVLESEKRLHCCGVSGQRGSECLRERLERTTPRRGDDSLPGAWQRGKQACSQKRALARARRADQGEQTRPLQLFPHGFDLDLAAEEVLRICLRERRQPGVGSFPFERGKTKGDFLECPRERAR